MVLASNDAFEVVWADPADGERAWTWDQAHAPRPLPPLAAEISDILHGVPAGRRRLTVNGYSYASPGPRPPSANTVPALLPPKDTGQVWFQELLPVVRASCDRLRDTDFDSLSEPEIAAQIDGIFAELAKDYAITLSITAAFRGAGSPIERFQEFCKGELGDEADILVATMLQGEDNETAASGLALGLVAAVAGRSSEVTAAVGAGRFESLGETAAGQEFLTALGSYLREYGWRAESFNSVHFPTWAEEPSQCLQVVRQYLAEPERSPAAAQSRARKQRQEIILAVEAKIEVPERKRQFRELLGEAESYVPINESRAHWQLVCGGMSRRPVMALGRKLAARGVLGKARDVWFLAISELKGLAAFTPPALTPNPSFVQAQDAPPTGGRGGPASKFGVIEERRADLARWERLSPPRYLGRPPAVGHSSGEQAAGPEGLVVRGIRASAGLARGRARVVMALGEADQVEPGDILVCPATSPSWMPLFAVVAAVVTDAGGVLSHPAIAAREYAIPCVVGTGDGTRRIPDDALVRVDGTAGVVLIEG